MPASLTTSLTGLLSGLTKEQLNDIRKFHQLKGMSSLNKSELSAALARALPESFEKCMWRMDKSLFSILQTLIRKGGSMEFEQALKVHDFADPFVLGEQMGLLFIQFDEVVVSSEFAEVFERVQSPELEAVIRRNTEWTRLTAGMLFYYGALELDMLIRKVSVYTGEAVDVREFLDVISMYALHDAGFDIEDKVVFYYTVDDPKWVLDEHAMRGMVDYYPFKKIDLLRAGEPDFVDKSAPVMNFVRTLNRLGLKDMSIAGMIAEEVVQKIQYGASPPQIIQELSEEFTFENENEVGQIMDALVQLHHGIRHWVLKGHMPPEFSAARKREPLKVEVAPPTVIPRHDSTAEIYDFQSRKKIGRNDPCPCGSGKKYKKCCGSGV